MWTSLRSLMDVSEVAELEQAAARNAEEAVGPTTSVSLRRCNGHRLRRRPCRQQLFFFALR